MFVLAVTVAVRTGVPQHSPSWTLRSGVVYLLELVLATVGACYALLTVAIYTLLRGIVPTANSREGVVWPEVVTQATDEAIAYLQAQLDTFEADLEEMAQRAVFR